MYTYSILCIVSRVCCPCLKPILGPSSDPWTLGGKAMSSSCSARENLSQSPMFPTKIFCGSLASQNIYRFCMKNMVYGKIWKNAGLNKVKQVSLLQDLASIQYAICLGLSQKEIVSSISQKYLVRYLISCRISPRISII